MGSRGDCFDNAVAESFLATLKKELIHRRSWPTRAEMRTEVFDYIETFYNRRRRHSAARTALPADYENSTPGDLELLSRRFATRTHQQHQVHYTNYQRRLKPPCPPNRGKTSSEHGSGLGTERWVVERTISWLHQARRLDRRYDRRADIHEAFPTLGCALVCHQQLQRHHSFC